MATTRSAELASSSVGNWSWTACASAVCSWERHPRGGCLDAGPLLLVAPVLVGPQALEIRNHCSHLFLVKLVAKRRHREVRRFVERISPAVVDDLRKLRIPVTPGMSGVI